MAIPGSIQHGLSQYSARCLCLELKSLLTLLFHALTLIRIAIQVHDYMYEPAQGPISIATVQMPDCLASDNGDAVLLHLIKHRRTADSHLPGSI